MKNEIVALISIKSLYQVNTNEMQAECAWNYYRVKVILKYAKVCKRLL